MPKKPDKRAQDEHYVYSPRYTDRGFYLIEAYVDGVFSHAHGRVFVTQERAQAFCDELNSGQRKE